MSVERSFMICGDCGMPEGTVHRNACPRSPGNNGGDPLGVIPVVLAECDEARISPSHIGNPKPKMISCGACGRTVGTRHDPCCPRLRERSGYNASPYVRVDECRSLAGASALESERYRAEQDAKNEQGNREPVWFVAPDGARKCRICRRPFPYHDMDCKKSGVLDAMAGPSHGDAAAAIVKNGPTQADREYAGLVADAVIRIGLNRLRAFLRDEGKA